MSEPQQPPVPSTSPAPPAASPLPANPQYPAGQPQYPTSPQYPISPQYPTPPQYQAGQPQYPAPPQHPYPATAQHPYPSAPQYPAAATDRTRNPLARTALVVAIATLALGVALSLMTPLLYRAVEYSTTALGLVSGVTALITLGGSAAALILGIIASRRPGASLTAGIAIGIAGAQIAGILIGWLSSALYSLI